MIDNIIANKTNVLILKFLIKFDKQFFSISEISKETGAGLRNIKDSLKILYFEGILDKKVSLGIVYYKFSADSKIKDILCQLFKEENNNFSFRSTANYKLLAEIESRIIKKCGNSIKDIILFGSVAKGRDTENSDIDIGVIVENKKKEIAKKLLPFFVKNGKDVQIHIFDSKEFSDAAKTRNPLIVNILRDGISLKAGK